MYYITPTLHNAVYWFTRLDKPMDELIDCLNKVKTPPNEAMQKGIQFEEDIMAYQNGRYIGEVSDCSDMIAKVSDIIGENPLWQETVFAPMLTSCGEVMTYGKADAVNKDWVFDIKYSKSYETGKYASSIQHLIYMHATGIEQFAYLIGTPNRFYREDYFLDDAAEDRLQSECDDLMRFIMNTDELRQPFKNNWQWKGR